MVAQRRKCEPMGKKEMRAREKEGDGSPEMPATRCEPGAHNEARRRKGSAQEDKRHKRCAQRDKEEKRVQPANRAQGGQGGEGKENGGEAKEKGGERRGR